MTDAQRRASDEGRATAPAETTQQSGPWTFGEGDGQAVPESGAPPGRPRPVPVSQAPAEAPAEASALAPVGEVRVFHGYDAEAAKRLVVSSHVPGSLVEQFRILAATLMHAQNAQGLKTVMVTSAAVGDGKSLTATNLALTLSKSYKRQVLLIDADLRRPSLHRVFRVPGVSGLSEGLNGGFDDGLPLIRISETLAFLPAGRPVSDPMAGLSSPRMKQIVDEAAAQFDWVILDTPPVGALADAAILSAMVGGSIMVVRAGVTPYAAVESAVDALGRDHIIGVLLNAVDASDFHSKGYYYHYYHYRGPEAQGQDTHDQGADR